MSARQAFLAAREQAKRKERGRGRGGRPSRPEPRRGRREIGQHAARGDAEPKAPSPDRPVIFHVRTPLLIERTVGAAAMSKNIVV
jgi:hypothetical protein